MLPMRYRRRTYGVAVTDQRPSPLVRIAVAAVALLIIWFLLKAVWGMFNLGSSARASAQLIVEQPTLSLVEVSLQGDDWQGADSNLKVYAGDSVVTKPGGKASVTFFDGTKMRLDEGTELLIEESENSSEGNSTIDVTMKRGRVWVTTPGNASFSGAITRTINAPTFIATVPADTNALVGENAIAVVKAAGIGLQIALHDSPATPFMVGEGQMIALGADALREIEEGTDPYDFRNPLAGSELIKDAFLVESYALAATAPVATTGSGAAPVVTADLTVTSPADNAEFTKATTTVSGRVGERVANVRVNGRDAAIKADRTFSVDLALSQDAPTVITIEAQDQQGITLSQARRTVRAIMQPSLAPVRVQSPVGSGGTFATANQEIEITGEAPLGANAIVVNDYQLQLFKPGNKTWSYLASAKLGNIVEGPNIFTIAALDADGRPSAPVKITIVYSPNGVPSSTPGGTVSSASSVGSIRQTKPLTPGVLSVRTPQTGTTYDTNDNEFSIEGVTSADTSTISVNGYQLSLYAAGSMNWKYIASTNLQTMAEGKNVYRIVARNAGGEILDVLEYTVMYRP